MDVKDYYDEYVDRQLQVGVNKRHRAILAWAQKFGMRPDSSVLELGCGVGTLTGLLGEALGEGGSIVAVDLSPASIESAERRLGAFGNVRLLAGDVLEMELTGRFDVVVLPDVIEHIPVERHATLFQRVASWVKPDGFVLLHYPSPHYQDWTRAHHPERLQIVDQTIHLDALAANAYPHGLYVQHLETYSIWMREGDYVVAVLRPSTRAGEFTQLPPPRASLAARLVRRVRRLAR